MEENPEIGLNSAEAAIPEAAAESSEAAVSHSDAVAAVEALPTPQADPEATPMDSREPMLAVEEQTEPPKAADVEAVLDLGQLESLRRRALEQLTVPAPSTPTDSDAASQAAAEADSAVAALVAYLEAQPRSEALPEDHPIREVAWNTRTSAAASSETLLWAAASAGHLALVDALIQHIPFAQLDVNVTVRETTPLMAAAMHGHTQVVDALLRHAPDTRVDVRDESGAGAFWYAVANSHADIAELLLTLRPDQVNVLEENTELNETAFLKACQYGLHTIVQAILSRGEDIVAAVINRPTGRDKLTPLHLAAKSGHVEVVRLLLSQPDTDVNAYNASCITPLMHAFVSRNVAVAELLLNDARIDVHKSTPSRVSPLYLAASQGYPEMVELLINCRERTKLNINEDGIGESPLFAAVAKKFVDIVNLLLKCEEIDPNQPDSTMGMTPLFCACEIGALEVIKALLSHPKIDPNASRRMDGSSPLVTAIHQSQSEAALALLEHPATDPNLRAMFGKGGSPLWLASLRGDLNVVKRLLDLKADVSPTVQGADAFWIACQENRVDIVKEMLTRREAGEISFDVNSVNDRKASCLFVAVCRENVPIVATLLELCPEVDVESRVGSSTILREAVARNSDAVLDLLVQYKSRELSRIVNLTYEDSKTAIWLACSKGHAHSVELLCRIPGIDVNKAATQSKFTALHIATAFSQAECVSILLDEHDAGRIELDFQAQDSEGHTALCLAILLQQKDIAQLLLHHEGTEIDKATFRAAKEQSRLFGPEDIKVLQRKVQLKRKALEAAKKQSPASPSNAGEDQGVSVGWLAAGGAALAAAVVVPWAVSLFSKSGRS